MSTIRAREAKAVPAVVLLVGFLTGPIIWSMHEIISQILIASACSHGVAGFQQFLVGGAAGWEVLLLIETVFFALVVVAADIIALRSWRRSGVGTQVSGTLGGAVGRSGWMALAGILLCTFFLIGILGAGATIFWLSGCG